MLNNTVQYTINVVGNAAGNIENISQAAVSASESVNAFSASIEKIRDAGLAFQAVEGVADRAAEKFGKIFTAGMESELQKQNLTTLLGGDIDAADTIFGKISEYGKETVYDKAGLIEAQKTMMSFGIASDDAFASLKRIGDIAMGDSQKMQSLALAFSQASSAGKLSGQDLMQMINAGFNPLQVISEKTGKSMSVLKDEMAKGQITTEMMAQAFQWATEEGGMFYEGAEKAGQTLSGRINQMKDGITEIGVQLFEVLQPAASKVIGVLSSMVEWVGGAMEKCSALGPVLTGVGIAVASFVVVTKLASAAISLYTGGIAIAKAATATWAAVQKVLNMAFWTSPITWIIGIVLALTAAIVIVAKKTEGWGETWNNTMEYLKLTFEQCGVWLHKKWLEIENFFMTGFETIATGWYKLQSLWDSDAANDGLAKIERQRDERAKAIAEAQGKLDELAEARKSIDIWQVKWKDKKEENTEQVPGTMASLMKTVNGGLDASSGSGIGESLSKSATATATGGTRNTEIKISLGKMVENINFNGGLEENETDMEQRLAEMLARILGMAETTAG